MLIKIGMNRMAGSRCGSFLAISEAKRFDEVSHLLTKAANWLKCAIAGNKLNGYPAHEYAPATSGVDSKHPKSYGRGSFLHVKTGKGYQVMALHLLGALQGGHLELKIRRHPHRQRVNLLIDHDKIAVLILRESNLLEQTSK